MVSGPRLAAPDLLEYSQCFSRPAECVESRAMIVVHGTYREGHVDLDGPVDWPNGSRVAVLPSNDSVGLIESDWPDSPETRAALLQLLDDIEPLELTAADEAEIGAAREAVRQVSVRAVRERMGLPS